MDTVEEVLAHFGVKGMKWGVRKDKQPASPDSAKSTAARQKAKKEGLHTLSNEEVRAIVDRMQLEQRYSQVAAADRNIMQKGASFAKELVVDTSKDVIKKQTKQAANNYVSKMVKEAIATGDANKAAEKQAQADAKRAQKKANKKEQQRLKRAYGD